MFEQQLTIEICLNKWSDRDHPQRMPLAERWRFHFRRGELIPPLIVVIESEIVFEGVGAHDIVTTVGKAKDDAT